MYCERSRNPTALFHSIFSLETDRLHLISFIKKVVTLIAPSIE